MILATLCSIGPLQSHLLTCCKLLLLERNKGAKISHVYSITHLTLTVLCFIEYTVYKQTPVLQPTTHTQQGKPPFVLTPMLLQWNNNRCFQTPAFPTVPPQFKSQLHRDIWPSLSPSSPQHEPLPSPAWGTPTLVSPNWVSQVGEEGTSWKPVTTHFQDILYPRSHRAR